MTIDLLPDESCMILRPFGLSRVARSAEDDSGRTNEGRYQRGKNPDPSRRYTNDGNRSISGRKPRHENRGGTNGGSDRYDTARAVSPRHASYLEESIFSKVRVRTEVVWDSMFYLTLYSYNNISWHFSVWNGVLYHFITEIAGTRRTSSSISHFTFYM